MRKALIIAAAATALIAGQASAHARLLSSTPKDHATVASPQTLVLHYSESIVASASSVTVSGPTGAAPTGPLAVGDKDKREVTVAFSAPLRPGAYKVAWKMHTTDDHTTDGTFGFKVK